MGQIKNGYPVHNSFFFVVCFQEYEFFIGRLTWKTMVSNRNVDEALTIYYSSSRLLQSDIQ